MRKYSAVNNKKLNVVLIMGESFSVNHAGRIPGNSTILAPNFAQLVKEGHYYNGIYATGQSTSRALSSIFYSMPPVPSEPLIMRKNHQKLDSLPKILKRNEYTTLFIYGGDPKYNSRDTLISDPEQFDKTIGKEEFNLLPEDAMSSWGVHDEYVLKRTIEEINQLNTEQPFFASVLTLSNHSPYSLPHHFQWDESQLDRNNAIRYADQAIGLFMEQARKQDWFEDTVFIIMADHGPYRSLNPTFPLVDYQIPLLFYAPKYIEPKQTYMVASEVDLAPTLLGKLGINYESTFFGRNIDDLDAGQHPVFLTKFESFGVLIHQTLIQLYPGDSINAWSTQDRQSFAKIDADKNTPEVKMAISYLQAASDMVLDSASKANEI